MKIELFLIQFLMLGLAALILLLNRRMLSKSSSLTFFKKK